MSDQPGSLPAVDQHQPSISGNSDLENSNPNIVSVQQVHGGGEAKIIGSNSGAAQSKFTYAQFFGPNSAPANSNSTVENSSGQGAESAPLRDSEASPGVSVRPGVAIKQFHFDNPFRQASPSVTGELVISSAPNASSSSNVSAHPSGLQPEHQRGDGVPPGEKKISTMSAKQLIEFIEGKITTIPKDAWIQEDLSGPAILQSVDPSDLDEILELVKISSKFMRSRVVEILVTLIEKDDSVPSDLRAKWTAFKAARVSSPRVAPLPSSPSHSAIAPNALFQSPVANPNSVAISSPAFFSGMQAADTTPRPRAPPSFMSEVQASAAFGMTSPSAFGDSTQSRAFIQPTCAAGGGSAMPIGGNFSITINQPAVDPPKFVLLESCSDPQAFYFWINKNRKEFAMARKVDHKQWNELIAHEQREEIARIIVAAKNTPYGNHVLFADSDCPYPSDWSQISDTLLLKVLFGLHGPRNAQSAVDRLTLKPFFFNDSTTSQALFTTKLRSYFLKLKIQIKDFAFNHHQWPIDDVLSRDMLRDVLTRNFTSSETVKGRDGTLVPKCSNLPVVRDIIKQKKGIPLEEIMNHIIDHFERIDISIRSSKGLQYSVVPWNTQQQKKPKRAFNAITPSQSAGGGAAAASGPARPPRPPPIFPRCCNCGSKMHAGTERNCYLWGHPKGKGASGVWPENGGPSLRLNPQEWKDWKVIRHAIFYAYPENAGPRPQTKQNGA